MQRYLWKCTFMYTQHVSRVSISLCCWLITAFVLVGCTGAEPFPVFEGAQLLQSYELSRYAQVSSRFGNTIVKADTNYFFVSYHSQRYLGGISNKSQTKTTALKIR
jgi:hypothetical protein